VKVLLSCTAEQMIDGGLRARLVCVDTRDLPPGIDACGENGEFHTCVYAGPMFRTSLALAPGEIVTREPFVWRDLVA
jgi:hypothetical protein